MKFQTEIDLVNLLKCTIQDKYKDIEIFEEVSLGLGIADMVVSQVNYKEIKLGLLGDGLGSFDIHLYSLIQSKKEITLDAILELVKCKKSVVLKSINILVDSGYVKEDQKLYAINREYDFSFKSNLAIEAKLKDWKRALLQAYRYRWFAERSYVVIDQFYSRPAIKNIGHFKKYNVGLASISTEGQLTRHYHPKHHKPFDIKMQMLFSEKVKYQLAVE